MRSLCRRALRVVLLLVPACGAACGRRGRPAPDRPSQPTLTVTPDPNAPTTGRRIVAAGQISQNWHVGSWSPASITLSDVAAGDAIVALGVYWVDLTAGPDIAPTDDRGTLQGVVNQGPVIVGKKKPPVLAQLFVEFDAAAGSHTIVPPYLGGQAGDGTLYVVQIRGLTEHRLIASGQTWVKGDAIANLSVALEGAAEPGDLVIALGGYDNTEPCDHPGWSHPPSGWLALGLQNDGSNNVPSELCYRVVPDPGAQPVTWTWADPKVNVAAAVIAALR